MNTIILCIAIGMLTNGPVVPTSEPEVVNVIATQPEIAPPETLQDQQELLKKILVGD